MEKIINHLPGGFFTLTKDYQINSVNHTLLNLLEYDLNQVVGKSVHSILSNSTSAFFQFFLYPLLAAKQQADEVYIELTSKKGKDIPALIYVSTNSMGQLLCNVVPINKRDHYEKQLLEDKEIAEDRLTETSKANEELKLALMKLEEKQNELLKVNQENLQYRIDTQRELNLAKKIQENSLTEPINTNHLQIESHYKASSELSGDTYGFYQINEHQYGVILLDVMGHGLSSALITMSLEALFQRLISKGFATHLVLKELDDYLHSLFHSDEESWHYCTAIYVFIDTKTQTIDYVNAGHPPAIFQNDLGEQKELVTYTPPIGSFEGMEFKATSFTYTKGSKLLLYTDGVSEPLGQERLSSLLKSYHDKSINDLKKELLDALDRETNELFKNDDQCFLLIDLK